MSTSSSTYEKRLQYCSIALFLNSLILVTKKLDGPVVVASFLFSLVLLCASAFLFLKMRGTAKEEKEQQKYIVSQSNQE
ncbi:hypothetical protein FY034_17390 (plasmid) [Trichlorobacter lovleyi]|uniref:hypothetical protein n=1 Tax=Trichlorobacter lovleyi TaxID=313985 RepID=UPI0022408FED|nr:hypothetical protein [Trichlorobacter lovleyi]QOX80798.1 hypothetical protein FY034_17390 [Trichlorobacter lovleyi]